MKATEFLSSTFIKKIDLDESIQLTITKMEPVEYEDKTTGKVERKLQATFSNDKALNLNATNLKRLIKAYGDDVSSWVGKDVSVYWDDEVEYAGQACGGIRLRAVRTAKQDIDEALPTWVSEGASA